MWQNFQTQGPLSILPGLQWTLTGNRHHMAHTACWSYLGWPAHSLIRQSPEICVILVSYSYFHCGICMYYWNIFRRLYLIVITILNELILTNPMKVKNIYMVLIFLYRTTSGWSLYSSSFDLITFSSIFIKALKSTNHVFSQCIKYVILS